MASASDHVVISEKGDIPARTAQPQQILRPHLQLPTVDEALQYSPLSSIVPFSPGMPLRLCGISVISKFSEYVWELISSHLDIIPFPNSHLSYTEPIFDTAAARHLANQQLDIIDRDLISNPNQSNLARRTLRDLLPYLDQKAITPL